VLPAYPPAAPQDPVEVYLLRQGDHTGVVLPAPEPGRWIEYAFGDWEWYANGRDSLAWGLLTLAVPSQGALGRREFAGPPQQDPVLRERGAELHPFLAERARVEALRNRLEAEFRASGVAPVLNPRNRLWMAPSAESYSLGNQCSSRTVHWLEDLGCSIGGFGVAKSVELGPPR